MNLSPVIVLILGCVFSSVGSAQEIPIFGFSRFGEAIHWNARSQKFPKVMTGVELKGTLTMAISSPIRSIHPYPTESGRIQDRPKILDDVHYESLMLKDPLDGTEKLYPLIARALTLASDLSYVVFEIDPKVRFQDGTSLSAADLEFSYKVLLNSSRAVGAELAASVSHTEFSADRLRFELKVRDQAARDVIMRLASMKIVKKNTVGNPVLAGIKSSYTSTGPYRITRLGPTGISLIKDPYYWGANLPTRRGFFNFRQIEVTAFDDEESAASSVTKARTNFYLETNANRAELLIQQLANSNGPLHWIEEAAPINGRRHSGYAFNLRRPGVKDQRVRQALLLAYDFDTINRIHNGGMQVRPLSLLNGSSLAPSGLPSPQVAPWLETCNPPKHSLQSFETYGVSQYAMLNDRRLRMLASLQLLHEAGYKTINGKLQPALNLTVLAATQQQARELEIFKNDLKNLGVTLQIVLAPKRESYQVLLKQGQFDFAPSAQTFLTPDGWPHPSLLRAAHHGCLDRLAGHMDLLAPFSDEYKRIAEAAARLQQAFSLSFFTGEPASFNFFMDRRIQVPAGLSVERAHLYGYWFETQ